MAKHVRITNTVGGVFTHPRGYTFEPVEIGESSDEL